MTVNLAIAFGAGLISFLSPCVLPLIPGYISYISGQNLEQIVEKKQKILAKTIIFSLGFSLVFISFGATASYFGSFLINYSDTLRIIAGIIIIIFSLQIMGVLKLNILNKEKRFYTFTEIATIFSTELSINVTYANTPRHKLVFDITTDIILSGLSLDVSRQRYIKEPENLF